MYFCRLVSVFVVSLGIFSSAFAAGVTQKSDRASASHTAKKNHFKITDRLSAQAIEAISPKQIMSAHSEDLRALMLALYESHPEELSKSAQVGPREMTEWVFDGKFGWRFDGLHRLQDQRALALLFDEQFQGDHVLALVVGLETSLFHGYGAENEFAIPSEQDPSRLQTLDCSLRDFQKRYHELISGPKVVPMLQEAASQQRVSAALDSILQRIASVTAQPCS